MIERRLLREVGGEDLNPAPDSGKEKERTVYGLDIAGVSCRLWTERRGTLSSWRLLSFRALELPPSSSH